MHTYPLVVSPLYHRARPTGGQTMRRRRLLGAIERSLLGAAMSAAAIVANWVLLRRLARRHAQER